MRVLSLSRLLQAPAHRAVPVQGPPARREAFAQGTHSLCEPWAKASPRAGGPWTTVRWAGAGTVSYTHLRAHETSAHL
eukprot:7129589-Alexandrium_andersonii.AAC.1